MLKQKYYYLSKYRTVTYNGNGNTGGSVPVDLNSPYSNNSSVTVLGNTGNLVKTNYTFVGWNTRADYTGTLYSPNDVFTITSNVTLYALWKPNKVMVRFKRWTDGIVPIISTYPTGQTLKVDGLINSNPSFVTIKLENDLSILDPTVQYNVVSDGSYHGWSGGTMSVSSSNPKNNGVYYYVLVYNTDFDNWFYGVKVRIKNGNTVISDTIITNLYTGTPVSVLVEDYGTCYVTKFVKFLVDLDYDYEVEIELLKEPSYTISLEASPAICGIVTGNGEFAAGTITSISASPNSGYNFVLWNDGIRETTRSIVVTENKTYIAQFTDALAPFTVTFDLNGHGTGSAPTALTLDSTTGFYATEPADPIDSSYIFSGWFDNSACTGQRWSFTNDVVVDNIILYAKWVSTANSDTIILFFNDNIYNQAAAGHDVGCLYSGNVKNPITSTLIPRWGNGGGGTSIICCTMDENDVWSDPREHLNMSNHMGYYKKGSTCIFRCYMNSLFEYELLGLSIGLINDGKLSPMQGIRKFDMPNGSGGQLSQVDCYYYEFIVTADKYTITPIFKVKTAQT